MIDRMLGSRTFKKTFFLYVITMLIPILIIITIVIQKNITEQRKDNYNKYSIDANRISKDMDNKLDDIKKIKESISNQVWVKKLIVESRIYDSEFDYIKHAEIREYMNNTIRQSNILCFGALIYPDKKIAVTQWGKYDLNYFFESIAFINVSDLKLIYDSIHMYSSFKIQPIVNMKLLGGSQRQAIPILQSLENVDKPRAALVLFIDKSYLDSYFQNIMGNESSSFSIIQNNIDIYTQNQILNGANKNSKDVQKFTIYSQVCEWKYEISYSKGLTIFNIKDIFNLFVIILLLLIADIILALFFAAISYNPLYKLFNNISYIIKNDQLRNNDNDVSEYNLIEESFVSLISENNNLKQIVNDYKGTAKSNLLFNLLKGFFRDDQQADRLKELMPSYSEDMYFCTLLLNINFDNNFQDSDIREKAVVVILVLIEKVIKHYGINYEVFEIENNHTVIILSSQDQFGGSEQIKKIIFDIEVGIKENCGITPAILCGNIEKNLLGISKSYYGASEKLQNLLFSKQNLNNSQYEVYTDSYYYPTDWEIQLINNLKVGSLNTLIRIIDEIKTENYKRNLPDNCMIKLVSLIMETIFRVLDELNIDTTIYKKQFHSKIQMDTIESLWDYIYEVGNLISNRVKYANSSSTIELGSKLLMYVNNNYTSSDMSLKKLVEVFGISIPSLSKMFKDVTGINFYDYLCRLRMDRAKVLLREGDYRVDNVANMVGYENVYSFKRAFVRYEGIKPDQYTKS